MSNQSVKAGEHGPSYRDADEHAEHVRELYGVGTRWHLSPPVARLDGRGRSSWTVTLEVWSLRTKEKTTWYHQAAFGNGGSWKTLPAALLATLRAHEQEREDMRVAAEAQQRLGGL
jgi:hypothetical protein